MDVKQLTLRQALQTFDEQRSKAGVAKYNPKQKGYTVTASQFEKFFPELMDKPGGAIALFTPDETGEFPASKLFKKMKEEGTKGRKSLMQETRYLGADFLRNNLPRGDEIVNILPVMDTARVEEFFGVPEPGKGESSIIPNSNAYARGKFIQALEDYKVKNPTMAGAVDAILFNVVQGVRPSVAIGLNSATNYRPDRMTVVVPSQQKGAKGSMYSSPLSDYADFLIQENIRRNKENGVKSNNIFNVLGASGKYRAVRPADTKKILSSIQIVFGGKLDPKTGIIRGADAEGLIFDPDQIDPVTGEKGVTYASFNPPDYEGRRDGGKFGQELMRNINTDASAEVLDEATSSIIQGRDVTQVSIQLKTGDRRSYTKYQKDPYRSYTKADGSPDKFRTGANDLVKALFDSAESQGLNLENTYFKSIRSPETIERITTTTDGYSKYFEQAKQQVKQKQPTEVNLGIPEENSALEDKPKERITSFEQFTDDLKEDLKGLAKKPIVKGAGKVLKTVLPPVAAGSAFLTGMEKGLGVGKSAALAATELVSPISPIDVYEGQKAVKKVKGFMEEKVEPKVQEGLKGFAQGFLGNLNLNINQ
tara:strand:- start:3347 stop:5122 length:1776 start_codon:yes stop_codon:yes gene_type:complete